MASPLPNQPTKYGGTQQPLVPTVTVNRAPTGADIRNPKTGKLYPIATIWQVGKNPTTGAEGDIWLLTKIVANVAYWVQYSTTTSSGVFTLSDTAGTTVDPTPAGNIQLSAGNGMSIVSDPGNNKLNFSATATVPLSFSTDSGTAVPALNILNVRGNNISLNNTGIDVTASGSTISIHMSSGFTLSDFTFQNSVAATPRTLQVLNADNDAASNSIMRVAVISTSNGDPFIQVGRNATYNYCWGIDNSDSGTLKICQDANSNAAFPSGGTVLWKMTTAGAASYVAGNLDVTRSASGSNVSSTISNTSNTPNSKSYLDINVAGTSADDAYVRFNISGDGTNQWALGMDNSDSQAFCLTHSSVLGGANIYRVDKSSGSTVFQAGDLSVSRASGGGNPSLSVSNTSNTASSNATLAVNTAGSSAGDPQLQFTNQVNNWTTGLDNSDSDAFVLSAASNLGTTNVMRVATTGEINYPLQPAFLAYQSASVTNTTGAGTTYTIGTTALTKVFDQNNDYNTNGTFTAPVTGVYQFNYQISVNVITAGMTSCDARIVTSNRSYEYLRNNPFTTQDSVGNWVISCVVLADMDAGDTATSTILISGGAGDTATIRGSSVLLTFQSGYLVA